MSRPSFGAAGSAGLAECLTEAFLALEEQMKEPGTRPELYSLSRGERSAGASASAGEGPGGGRPGPWPDSQQLHFGCRAWSAKSEDRCRLHAAQFQMLPLSRMQP